MRDGKFALSWWLSSNFFNIFNAAKFISRLLVLRFSDPSFLGHKTFGCWMRFRLSDCAIVWATKESCHWSHTREQLSIIAKIKFKKKRGEAKWKIQLCKFWESDEIFHRCRQVFGGWWESSEICMLNFFRQRDNRMSSRWCAGDDTKVRFFDHLCSSI